jgi:spermidine synthase
MNQSTSQQVMRYLLILIVAGCSILYELIAAQTLSLLAANTVVWYSLTIGTFLLSMGVGSIVSIRWQRIFGVWEGLFWVEIILAIVGSLIVLSLHASHMLFLYFMNWGSETFGMLLFFLIALIVVFSIGLLTGIELPLLIEAVKKENPEAENVEGKVLAVDYTGSLIGTLLFPLVLLPTMSLPAAGFLVAGCNGLAALFVLVWYLDSSKWRVFKGALVSVIIILIGCSFFSSKRIQQYLLKKFYFNIEASDSLATLFAPMQEVPSVSRFASAYQKIDIVQQEGDGLTEALMDTYLERRTVKHDFVLFLNGDFQFHTDFEDIYHEYFAHVPVMCRNKVPERVLVLGGGDGLLIKEILKHEGVKSVTHVDLDPTLIEVAKTDKRMLAINGGSLLNPRVNTLLADAYYYVRTTSEQYDAIYIDFPMAADYNLAKLYSREFFQMTKRLLRDDGFVVFDATGIGLLTFPDQLGKQYIAEGNDWDIYYHTLKKAGYDLIVPYITTLERDNPKAFKLLLREGLNAGLLGRAAELALNVQNSNEAQVLQHLSVRSLLTDHVVSLQQGFIMMA